MSSWPSIRMPFSGLEVEVLSRLWAASVVSLYRHIGWLVSVSKEVTCAVTDDAVSC